jgi:hypothetical protein
MFGGETGRIQESEAENLQLESFRASPIKSKDIGGLPTAATAEKKVPGKIMK